MDQYIPTPSSILDPLERGLESMRGILGLAIIEVEFEVDKVLGVGKVQVDARAHCRNIILLQFTKIMGEFIAADPYFS